MISLPRCQLLFFSSKASSTNTDSAVNFKQRRGKMKSTAAVARRNKLKTLLIISSSSQAELKIWIFEKKKKKTPRYFRTSSYFLCPPRRHGLHKFVQTLMTPSQHDLTRWKVESLENSHIFLDVSVLCMPLLYWQHALSTAWTPQVCAVKITCVLLQCSTKLLVMSPNTNEPHEVQIRAPSLLSCFPYSLLLCFSTYTSCPY